MTIKKHILHWLASLGYRVYGKPNEEVLAMFLREARQWQMTPWELEHLVRVGYEEACRARAVGPAMRPPASPDRPPQLSRVA